MIGSLRGTVIDRRLDEVLVEVGGLGYRVSVTPATVVQLADGGAEVFLHVHHHRREDAETLYGFLTRDERDCFEALIAAHGVGPALALAILSVHDPDALRRVLLDEDVAALCLVPGVGKKTAARLLMELSSKLALPDAPASGGAVGGARRAGVAGDAARVDAVSARADVREALLGLGYGPDEVVAVLRDLPDGADAAALLRDALQLLAVGSRS
jgi:Holliday junction DNA helicase RuvA